MSSWWGILRLPDEATPEHIAQFEMLGKQARAALSIEHSEILNTPPLAPIPFATGRDPGSIPNDWGPGYCVGWVWVFNGDEWFMLFEGNMNWENWDHHGYTHWLPWWAIPLPEVQE
jgi:hypothetical protein